MTMSNGRRDQPLHAPLINSWGIALKLCREERNLSRRDIAENIGVQEATVALWELNAPDAPVPSTQRLKRLYGRMWKLKSFDFLVPKAAQKVADMQEVAEARKERQKPPPEQPEPEKPPPAAPEAPKYKDFGDALWKIRLKARLSAQEVANAADLVAASIYRIEKGAEALSPDTYRGLLLALPELKEAPPPMVRAGRGEIYSGAVILEEFFKPPVRWVGDAREFSDGAPAPQIAPEPPPSPPAPSGPLPEGVQLAMVLTESYGRLAEAQRRAAEAWDAAAKADEELTVAQAAVNEAQSKLRASMGLGK